MSTGKSKFLEKIFGENAKCARLQVADRRKGNVKSIQMI